MRRNGNLSVKQLPKVPKTGQCESINTKKGGCSSLRSGADGFSWNGILAVGIKSCFMGVNAPKVVSIQ